MVLGSPSSPPGHESSRISNPKQFLPGYLLGTSQSPQLTKTHHIGDNPERGAHRVTWSPDLVQTRPRTSLQQRQNVNISARERFGGPPVRGLSIDAEMSSSSAPGQPNVWQNASFTTLSPRKDQNETNYSFFDAQQKSFVNSYQMDPFYTQGEDFDPVEDLDECCVTVFGFPSQSASYILQEFSQYGVITNYEIPNKCNWMHLRYVTKLQAKKALSKNTKIFNGSIQIGVTPCIDKEAVIRLQGVCDKLLSKASNKRLQESNLPLANASFVSNPLNDTSFLSSSQNPKASMRSLTAAYTSPSKVATEFDSKTNDGLINKAWNYMFGF